MRTTNLGIEIVGRLEFGLDLLELGAEGVDRLVLLLEAVGESLHGSVSASSRRQERRRRANFSLTISISREK